MATRSSRPEGNPGRLDEELHKSKGSVIVSSPITERRLVDVLVGYLGRDNDTAREVSHYEKRIDLLVAFSETDELWGIEAKTTNWNKALAQAILNLSAVERSYIAIYEKNVHRVREDLLDRYGIGLISVGTKWGDVAVLREARRSELINKLVLDELKLATGNRE